ncbi:MAG: hypothetical protein ABIO59_05000 [Luteimonas sp.]
MSFPKIAAMVCALALLSPIAACNRSPNTLNAATTPAGLSLSPAMVRACDPPAVVTLTWNVQAIRPAVATVQLWTNAPGTPAKLFAEGGPVDHATTGAWARPGMVFVLKAKTSGTELFHTTLGGPRCP